MPPASGTRHYRLLAYLSTVLEHLNGAGYGGLLLLDDIHLSEVMEGLRRSIPQEKPDLTALGHWSGTGLVVFLNRG